MECFGCGRSHNLIDNIAIVAVDSSEYIFAFVCIQLFTALNEIFACK
jgi:hypothetical protein